MDLARHHLGDVAMTKGTVTVDGCELTYVREGHGPSRVVIGSAIHYQKAFSHRLRQHVDLICADGRHVVPSYAPASDALQRLTLDTFADDVEVIRQHIGVDRMAVLGHSVHAQIALAYTRKYAQRTSHLILIGGVPYAFAEFAEEAARVWQEHASPARKAILETNVKDLDARLAAAPATRSFEVTYRAHGPLYWADPAYDAVPLLEGLENGPAFDRLFALVPSRAEVRRSLEHVRVPSLLVLGRLDFAIPHTVWEALIAGLNHVTYVLLQEDSHTPHAESPERFDTD
jgi:proline iminopeptidase